MSNAAGRFKAGSAMGPRRHPRPAGSETAAMAVTAKVITATRLTTEVMTFAAIVMAIIVLAVGMIVAPFAITTWYAFEYPGDLTVKAGQEVTGNRGRVLESPTRPLGVRGVHKARGGTLAPRVAGVEGGSVGTQLGSRQEPGPTATQERQRRLRSGHGRDDHGPGSRIRNG